ncbi:class I adenylate-forming enzyme family protein [Falsiruegeria litorea]|uniref:class I adenylate-forming enzyme family protein n=1 Tax=Falsiruegeria litorea TaxID=1280831 RepID=UPI000A269D93|nr:AMP-binding protein [Falsiruegeria litorea]
MSHSPICITAPQSEDIAFLDFGTAFVRHAEERPDQIAVVDEAVSLTWRSFDRHARCVAARLRADGVGPGTPVAALADNSAAYLAFYAGVILAGGAMVPLPTSATVDVLTKMLTDCGARLRFASDRHSEMAATLGFSDAVLERDLFDWAEGEPLEHPVSVPSDSMFDLIYSSGTTGTPKGIIHDHLFRGRQLMRMPVFGLDQDARLLMSTPLYSNTTQVAVLPVLARGGTVVSMAKFDTVRFLELSQQHAITHAILVPVQYMRLMREPSFDDHDLSSYRTKLSTSAPLPGPLIRDILDRWPGKLFELYGMTEGGISTVLDCVSFPDKLDTVGRPVQGCDARIIDEDGIELPPGEFGEVVGRAGAMMQGYLNADAKTQEATWCSPEGEDFIRTGDMGRFDADGFLTLMDRKKDMILSGGFNIYAADLERVLRDHPDVADVAVIAIPSEAWGETPLGLVVRRPKGQATGAEIMDWANARLGKTQRLSRVELRDDLPRSSIGKILKRELRAPFWDQS